MEDCIFCKIVAGEIPGNIIHQNDEVLAFHDVNPVAPSHVLIIPRKHISSMNEANDADRQVLGELMLRAKAIANELGINESGYRMVVNTGRGVGQTVFHIHLHLMGGRAMGWPPG